MDMSWHDLLFMHWPVQLEQLRPLVPEALEIDRFNGEAWVGVVPFRMTRVKPHRFPSIPGCSEFLELNVRTYVTHGARPGVWFFSLDAANPVAVAAARHLFHLPYFNARMSLIQAAAAVQYRSTRTHRKARPADYVAEYGPTGPFCPSEEGSLDAWLTERYCLYAADRKQRLWRTEIHHSRWPLQPAQADVQSNTMAPAAGIVLPDAPPLLHFAKRLDVVAWKPSPVV